MGNKLLVKGLGLHYDGSNVRLNGEISHFYHFLFNKEQNIEANMDISSSQFYTKHFILNPDLRALIDERVSDLVLKKLKPLVGKMRVLKEIYHGLCRSGPFII